MFLQFFAKYSLSLILWSKFFKKEKKNQNSYYLVKGS
jgi:hypothetical protein